MARKKKPTSKSQIKALQQKIEAQRRRALRPSLPINARALVSESRVEKERKLERKRRQRRNWEDA
jgi:hypothetical protein